MIFFLNEALLHIWFARNLRNISTWLAVQIWAELFLFLMMNCFCGMIDRHKALSLISSWDHCQRSSPRRISDTSRAGFEPAQNLSSGFVEWSRAVAITIAPGCLYVIAVRKINFDDYYFDIESYSVFRQCEVVVGNNIREQTCCLYILSYSSPLPC